jgi:hypothetical protein
MTWRGATFTLPFPFEEDWKPIMHLRLKSWYDTLGGEKPIAMMNGVYISQLLFNPFTTALQLTITGVTPESLHHLTS